MFATKMIRRLSDNDKIIGSPLLKYDVMNLSQNRVRHFSRTPNKKAVFNHIKFKISKNKLNNYGKTSEIANIRNKLTNIDYKINSAKYVANNINNKLTNIDSKINDEVKNAYREADKYCAVVLWGCLAACTLMYVKL